MKALLTVHLADSSNVHPQSDLLKPDEAQLVLCFGGRAAIEAEQPYQMLRQQYPMAQIAICSTAGEIFGTNVYDGTLTVAALQFKHTPLVCQSVNVNQYPNSYQAGKTLLQQFNQQNLSYVLVLSDGSRVNGSELAKGMSEIGGPQLLITGGMAGDGSSFQSTLVGLNSNPVDGLIVAIGFYGKAIKVQHGTKGGWETFGPERKVTKSAANILYEVDGKKVLDIYKRYLGAEAASLPGSALLFPLSVVTEAGQEALVRTILSIDEDQGSMTFAGDIPQGAKVRFMKANFDKLTAAASGAAQAALDGSGVPPKLALLISCVGRKLILQSRTEEEVEAIDDVFNQKTMLTGFYSYGEISPFVTGSPCQLHNQTMTITTFDESE